MAFALLAERLLAFIKERGFKSSKLFELAGIDKLRGYEIINGVKYASRDEVIRLCVALGLSFDVSQDLLASCGFAPLEANDSRESAIVFALRAGGDVEGLNNTLISLDFEPLEA